MRARSYLYAGFAVLPLLVVMAGVAQSQIGGDKPVWTMEVIQAKPGKFGPTLGYLDENWVRVREEAKREGAVVDYHRIAEETGSKGDGTIVLLTEFKNQAAYDRSDKLFASILKNLQRNPSGVVLLYQHEDLYDRVSMRIFEDYSEAYSARFRLLAKQ